MTRGTTLTPVKAIRSELESWGMATHESYNWSAVAVVATGGNPSYEKVMKLIHNKFGEVATRVAWAESASNNGPAYASPNIVAGIAVAHDESPVLVELRLERLGPKPGIGENSALQGRQGYIREYERIFG